MAAIFLFDSIVWRGGKTGFNYYLDWALNEFTSTGYNQTTDYMLGTSLFNYTTKPFISDDASVVSSKGNMSSRLAFNYAVTEAGSITLNGGDFCFYEDRLYGDYFVRFGEYGNYPFHYEVNISYGVIVPGDSGNYTFKTHPLLFTGDSELVQDVFTCYEVNLCDVLRQTFLDLPGDFTYIDSISITFSRIGDSSLGSTLNPDSAVNNSMWVSFDVYEYSNGDPYRIGNWIRDSELSLAVIEGPTYVTEFPTNWTQWLGDSVEGFMDAEVVPGFSLGVLFWSVLGVLIVWFILHLFM